MTRLTTSSFLCLVCFTASIAQAAPGDTANAQPAASDDLLAGGTDPCAPRPADGGERPWAKGVTPEEQKTALALFQEGNKMLGDSLFVKAADKYREALAHWDHPAIHYNLALALLNLDNPIEVYKSLDKALAYGVAPLDADKCERAKNYKQLIAKQIAHVDIACQTAGAKVTLDGTDLFTAPGKYEGLVRIGQHAVVARKDGFVTATETRTLTAGDTMKLDIKLFTADQLTVYKRRWSPWVPWTVVASGAVVAGIGGVLNVKAAKNFDDFDKAIKACMGCMPTAELAKKKDNARLQQNFAVAGYIVGGAALATGLVLVYINREQAVRVEGEAPEREPAVSVAPLFGDGVTGATASFRF